MIASRMIDASRLQNPALGDLAALSKVAELLFIGSMQN
jgi:hypothetical protein